MVISISPSSEGPIINAYEVYKIVDLDGEKIKTLFHGQDGSRVLPRNKWMRADERIVRDGSSRTWYWSGWHVFRHLEEARHYLQRFRNMEHKAIVLCFARELRSKSHSRAPVLLARDLYVRRIVWRAFQEESDAILR